MSAVIDTPGCSTKRKSEELISSSQKCYVPPLSSGIYVPPIKKKKKKGKNEAAVSGDSSNNKPTMTKKMRRQLREQERLEKIKARNKGILDGTVLTKRQKRKLRQSLKIVGTVLLSTSAKERIQEIVNSYVPANFPVEDNSYANISDSSFKREFISSIRGKLEERLLPYSLDSKRDSKLDQMYYDELTSKQDTDFIYRSLQKKREMLPAHKLKNIILSLINSSQVVVISGETGCGKTTQIPQFILDDCIENKQGSMCRIVCTQPRRISAIAVAERVAEERREELGISCGYSIRLERELPRDRASMVFCTVGIVLRHLEKDPSLKSISHLIIDEIHEREIKIDFLICIVKQIIAVRKDLKVILMSATLNAEAFSAYFDNAPHINIPGFTFPVEEYYLEDVLERVHFQFPQKKGLAKKTIRKLKKYVDQSLAPFARSLQATGRYSSNTIDQLLSPLSEELNMDLVFALLVDICEKEYRPGAVLIFLPGFGEINNLIKLIEASGRFPVNRYIIIPLHSQIATINQKEIFHPAPPNKRKIIIATNIAETSITIDDVVYVIDCGKMKVVHYNPDTNIQSLEVHQVSIANATQRKGRAGRTQSGKCFHLFSSGQLSRMAPFLKPEILRRRLEDTILCAKKLQVGKIDVFFKKLMDAPSDNAVKASLDLLKRLNAIDSDENLTPLGYHLSKLPLAPQIGKMLLFGIIFSCLDPVLSIAASLDFKDAFLLPFGKERQVTKKRFELADGVKSDHYLLYRAMNRFENARDKRGFCREFFLSFQTMNMLVKLKSDFMRILYQMEFVDNYNPKDPKYNFNSHNISLIKAIICGGLYPNIVFVERAAKKRRYKLPGGQNVRIHPKSILHGNSEDVFLESSLLVYNLLMKSSRNFIYDATMVHPLPVIMFGDRFEQVILDDGGHISIGEGLLFKCSVSTLGLIKEVKSRLDWFLTHRISHPGIVDWHQQSPDINLLRTISDMITNEDQGNLELDAYDDHDEVAPAITGDKTNKELVKPTSQKHGLEDISGEEKTDRQGAGDLEDISEKEKTDRQGAGDLEDISEKEKTDRQGAEDLEDISEEEKTDPQRAEDLEDITEEEKTDPQRAEDLEDISDEEKTDFMNLHEDEDSDEEIMNLPW